MADRDSASESDSSSIDGGPIMMPPSPVTREQLQKRIDSLQQQNRVLKVELETYKLRVKALQEENRGLRQASVIIVISFPLFFCKRGKRIRLSSAVCKDVEGGGGGGDKRLVAVEKGEAGFPQIAPGMFGKWDVSDMRLAAAKGGRRGRGRSLGKDLENGFLKR